jgi:hypothetical protein
MRKGMNNRAIAAELNISRRTVETHRAKMRMRTQLGTTELIEFAISTGIVEKDEDGATAAPGGETRTETRRSEETGEGAGSDA